MSTDLLSFTRRQYLERDPATTDVLGTLDEFDRLWWELNDLDTVADTAADEAARIDDKAERDAAAIAVRLANAANYWGVQGASPAAVDYLNGVADDIANTAMDRSWPIGMRPAREAPDPISDYLTTMEER